MSDRLEVLPGPGTVVRHGHVGVWAGPVASAALLSFLAQSARNVGESAGSGLEIVDHIAGILSSHDPEPGAPFAVIGPGRGGWVTLLHGPVQLWDGSRWLAPTPHPGWLRSEVQPQPAVSVGPAGSPSPRLSPDSPYDLGRGIVPGGGFILVPDPSPAGRGASAGTTDRPLPSADAPTNNPPPPGRPQPFRAPSPSSPPPAAGTGTLPRSQSPQTDPGPTPGGGPGDEPRQPPGVERWISLRAAAGTGQPALPIGAAPIPPGRPQVTGVRCERDHFNHPAALVCAVCGRPIVPGRPRTSGARPVLGVLVAADDGSTIRLDVDQVLGSDPTTDPGVAAGRLRPVVLIGVPGQLAPAHAELRLTDWTLSVIDRGSAVGTFVVPTGTTGWARLTPYQPATLRPGSHLSIGQRVFTFLSPWPG
jgi:hypothetical protein